MKAKSLIVYLFFILFYAILIALSIFAFSIMPNPLSYPEGFFITPGNVQLEWIFAIVMSGITGTIAGVISIFLVAPVFMKIYAKSLAKKHKIKLVPVENISNSTLFRKMWARSYGDD